MKWFAMLLLIANVAIFGWQFNAHVRDQVTAAAGIPSLPPGTPGLRLIAELAEKCGKPVTWDKVLNSEISIMPEKFAWDANPPSMPDENGEYAIPVPGVTKTV